MRKVRKMKKVHYIELFREIRDERTRRGEEIISEEIRILKKDRKYGLVYPDRKARLEAIRFLKTMKKYVRIREMILEEIWLEHGLERHVAIHFNSFIHGDRMQIAKLLNYNMAMELAVKRISERYGR